MVHFSLIIKACCLYVIWEKQDQIWARNFLHPQKYALPDTHGPIDCYSTHVHTSDVGVLRTPRRWLWYVPGYQLESVWLKKVVRHIIEIVLVS